MKAMILSGGRGKRLRPLTDTIPKPLIQINGIPIIVWSINYLKKFGITDIILCTGYRSKQIEEYLNKKNNLNCKIDYSVEKEALGTGGAIKKFLLIHLL
jgi:NDP-sugar pyrophosphorylase family protein